ncbi:MAG TPA: hypothetical protein VHJ20_12440 [Polyangia bacterium]|nr:hypothetical protein [Polyangia bacterium]
MSVTDTSLVRSSDRASEIDDIEAEIALARARVSTSVRALGNEVARVTDWRGWVRAHPGWLVAGAFAAGLWIGRGRSK